MSTKGRYTFMPAGMESEDEDEDGFSKDLSVKKTCENLKITVVPDITATAGLNGQPFDGALEPEWRDWFEQLKSIWLTYKRGPTLTQKLYSMFSTCSNPFVYGLKLYANCSGTNSPKTNSLAYAILDELHNFKTAKRLDSTGLIDDNTKMVAFNFVKKQGQPHLYKIVVNTFDLMSSRHLFIAKLKELIEENCYKEACQWARELQLYNEFTIFDFVFPLILQDKSNFAEEYLNKAKHLQRPLIELLDSLLDKSTSIQNRCGDYICKYNYTDVKLSKLQSKPLTKLITRLVKNYRLEATVMPNVVKMKSYGALQFLIHKNYQERSLNKDSWQEMVKDTVPRQPEAFDLQMELIYNCTCNKDNAEAAYWYRYFDFPFDRLPNVVKDYIEQGQNDSQKDFVPEADWDEAGASGDCNTTTESHRLSLDESSIVLVDERNKFYKMLKYLSGQYLISFDAEWKPTFSSTNELALIQIATREYIYLIDVVQLNIGLDDWSQLGKYVFNNNEILKLGFSVLSDLSMFQKTIPGFDLSVLTRSSYLDLQEFWLKLNTVPMFQFPHECDTSANSLGVLLQLCLGKKLDKSNQFSNWEKRPLRKDQINYAALDAFCLFEIYDIIEQQFKNLGEDFNDFVNHFLTEKKRKQIIKKSNQNNVAWTATTPSPSSSQGYRNGSGFTSEPYVPNSGGQSSVHPSSGTVEYKFICDTMLEGLTTALINCGVDAVYMAGGGPSSTDHCINVGRQENRIVLTQATVHRQYIEMGQCYRLRSIHVEQQLQEVIDHFSLYDAYNHCDRCRGDDFLMASQHDIREMFNSYRGDPLAGSSSWHRQQQYDRSQKQWKWSQISTYHKRSHVTNKGVRIQIGALPKTAIDKFKRFFICEGCGACYWDETSAYPSYR